MSLFLVRGCHANGRFLGVCIGHPAPISDYLSFATSSLKQSNLVARHLGDWYVVRILFLNLY
jgi:hypothetical protein